MASCLENSLRTVKFQQTYQQMKLGVRMGNAAKITVQDTTCLAPPLLLMPLCQVLGFVTRSWPQAGAPGWIELLSKDWRNVTLSSVPFPPTVSVVRVNLKLRQKQKIVLGTYSLQWTSKICTVKPKQMRSSQRHWQEEVKAHPIQARGRKCKGIHLILTSLICRNSGKMLCNTYTTTILLFIPLWVSPLQRNHFGNNITFPTFHKLILCVLLCSWVEQAAIWAKSYAGVGAGDKTRSCAESKSSDM